MKPAQADEILRPVIATPGAIEDVVDFEVSA